MACVDGGLQLLDSYGRPTAQGKHLGIRTEPKFNAITFKLRRHRLRHSRGKNGKPDTVDDGLDDLYDLNESSDEED